MKPSDRNRNRPRTARFIGTDTFRRPIRTVWKALTFGVLLIFLTLPLDLTAQRRKARRPPPTNTVTAMTQAAAVVSADAAALAAAMDVPAADLVSASLGTTDPNGTGVGTSRLGRFFPRRGTSFAILSTGLASDADSHNDSESRTGELNGLNNSEGEDMVQLRLVLRPPATARCAAFDVAFYSEEFPEFVGTQFNDAFTAEVGGSDLQIINKQVVSPFNVAFDTAGNPISVNTVFGVSADTASTYDGATPLLRVTAPLDLSAFPQVEFVITIQDLGDSAYDSAVMLDSFSWLDDPSCQSGAVLSDSDGDGLLDEWEQNGIDVDQDGDIDLDLAAMGADPQRKDVFVEVDYMVQQGICILSFCFGGHSHKPEAASLQRVIDAFANSPVSNPDGSTGITLHIDAGPTSIMDPRSGATWGTRSQTGSLSHDDELGWCGVPDADGACTSAYQWAEFDQVKGVGSQIGHFSAFRRDAFHYVVFAHKLGASRHSGYSRGIHASDFIVSLGDRAGAVGTVGEQAGTLMHELGHNLGLQHGGGDDEHRKPNYLSIMSYSFQTRGLRLDGADGHFDYSFIKLPDLNENNLNETVGLNGGFSTEPYGTRYGINGQHFVNRANGPIDWNDDGDQGADVDVAVDINSENGLSILQGFNDWQNLRFDGGAIGKLGQIVVLPAETHDREITIDEDLRIPTPLAVDVQGPGDLFVAPGAKAMYRFVISNQGAQADTYVFTVSSDMGWADGSGVQEALLNPGESLSVDVGVSVPVGVPVGLQDRLVLSAGSRTNARLIDSTTVTTTVVLPGDLNHDGQVDRVDLDILLADRNRAVADSACGSACDLDSDGKITALDARKLTTLCTRPRCAVN